MSIEKHQIGVLLSQVALRDRKAFEALYQLTSTRLFNVIVSVIKDEQQAADILQDGFVKLWHGRQRYPIDHPWAWLCQTMRNLAIDELRRKRLNGEQLIIQQEVIEENEETLVHKELHRCLQTLEIEKRNAIVLAYQHGLSHQEIVQHIKAPLGTVKSWVRRGLQELKKCLIEH